MFASQSFASLSSERYVENPNGYPEEVYRGRDPRPQGRHAATTSRYGSYGKYLSDDPSPSPTSTESPSDEYFPCRFEDEPFESGTKIAEAPLPTPHPPGRYSRSSEEERRQETRISPEAKKLIYKLLDDYEQMERKYQEEKFMNTRNIGAVVEQDKSRIFRKDSSLTATTEAESSEGNNSGLPSDEKRNNDVSWNNQSGRSWFEPRLNEESRQSYINTPVKNALNMSSSFERAPDPPDNRQSPVVLQPNFRSFVEKEQENKKTKKSEDDDRDDDDLSSRAVNTLIEEEVKSDCKAAADHLGGHRQYWRDIILGVNDGIVSTFLLVAGVAGGGLTSNDILLTAVAGAVAGAVSMCSGEYVATKSQNEVVQGEIKMEQNHIRDYHRDELIEVSGLLELIGITDEHRDLQRRLLRHYARDPKALLKIMIALELGFLEDEERSPAMAGLVSFFLFLAGSIPPIIPFMVPDIDPTVGIIVSAASTIVTLMIVGGVKTWATKGNMFVAAIENLVIAGFGGAFAYGAGMAFDQLLHQKD